MNMILYFSAATPLKGDKQDVGAGVTGAYLRRSITDAKDYFGVGIDYIGQARAPIRIAISDRVQKNVHHLRIRRFRSLPLHFEYQEKINGSS